MINEKVGIRGTVVAIHENGETGEKTKMVFKNIVCTAGSKYYSMSAVGEEPTNDFAGANAGVRLGTGTTTPAVTDTDVKTYVTDSAKAKSAGYPKTNDTDANNTGAGVNVVTWKYYWAADDFTGDGVAEIAVVDNTTTPTACLMHALFPSTFNQNSTDTLTVFVNHAFADNT
jgi:hypothetical protein